MVKTPLIVSLALMSLQLPAFAFHDQGSGDCEGCHVSHNTEDGMPLPPGMDDEWLLKGETPSDVCLSCHAESFGGVLTISPLAPAPEKGAGNFVFLWEDNLNDAPDGVSNPIPGDAAGHNLDAPSYGLFNDSRWASSPGGTFPTDQLGCTSCHDPHGNTNYRLLRGAGPVPLRPFGTFTFSNPAPEGEGIALSSAEGPSNHAAYHAGMSRWCGNCHGQFHQGSASAGFEHPTQRALSGDEASRYNAYAGDDNPSGGSFASAYLPEVPFEDRSMTTTSREGARAGSGLMCLSCHRAHASSSPAAGRWDFKVQALGDDGLVSGSYPIPNPYSLSTQGPLCLKCHSSANPD